MRSFLTAVSVVLSFALALAQADTTIRYKVETSSPMALGANTSHLMVIYMKGNQGVTVVDGQTTIADFARQQVTIIDTVRRRYATVPASEYAGKLGANIAAMMPAAGGDMVSQLLKSMKTSCNNGSSGVPETIQGVQAEEREVTCAMTMTMPDALKATMPSMSVNMVMRVWSAAPGERLRVPGLWQLSGFELWQKAFMNPAGSLGKMAPEGMMPMIEAMQKDQSATLRMNMEVSMKMPMPGMPAGDTPIMKMSQEVAGLSTELLDDSLFSIPGDCSAQPFEDVMKGITDALVASAKGSAPATPSSKLDAADQYADHKEYATAEAIYRQVVQAEPHNVRALKGLAKVLYNEDKIEESATVLDSLPKN